MKIKHIRGTTEQNLRYTGPDRTLSVDTNTGAVHVHDGKTMGGHPASNLGPFPAPTSEGVYAIKDGRLVPVNAKPIKLEAGPGPQELLHGTMEAGYYGRVSQYEFFNAREVAMYAGMNIDSNAISTPLWWLKFAYRGKILYVAKHALVDTIYWNQIYRAGCVYGIDDVGPFPSGDPVNQLRLATRAGQSFKIRLLRGANTDPVSAEGTAQSEWDQLVYRVTDQYPETPENPRWDNLSAADLSLTSTLRATFCQERSASNQLQRLARGSTNNIASTSNHYAAGSNTTYRQSWRPVLELIN